MNLSEFWNYILSLEKEYGICRKKISAKFSLSSAETDIIMFLANNPGFDTASDISKIRKIPKSQVSMSVNSLYEKKLLEGFYKENNKKSIHLKLTKKADDIVLYGRKVQRAFAEKLFSGFTDDEKAEFTRLYLKICANIENEEAIKK